MPTRQKDFSKLLKKLINQASYSSHVPSSLKKNLKELFSKKLLTVVDVGATGGVEKRWRPIQEFCHFITFDPDLRAENLKKGSTNFPIGLWSKKEKKQLNCAAFQAASSVFPFHRENLSAFLNAPCHEIVSSQTIALDTLEGALGDKFQPDFIKIDAEGADLEILKGSAKFLKSSCLGIQVEAPFYERHKAAPFFSEIDLYLRSHGFILLDLTRERWIRKNNLHGPISRPQVVWANAIYMLSIETFLQRVKPLKAEEKELAFFKFLTLLLIYQMHDYAEELRKKAFQQNLISSNTNMLAHKITRKSMPSKVVYFAGLGWNIFLGIAGLAAFFWHPSVRKQSSIFLKSQMHLLASATLNSLRTGPYQSCLSDEE